MSLLSRRSSGDGSSAVQRGSHADVHMIDVGEAGAGTAPELSPKTVFAVAWRRKWTLLGCVAAALVGGLVYLKYATPLYTGQAQLYVQKNGVQLINQGPGVLGNDETYVFTQITVMKSTPVLTAALDGLDVVSMLTFAETPSVPGAVNYLRREMTVELGKRDGTLSIALDSPSPDEAQTLVDRVIGSYKRHLAEQSKTNAGSTISILQKEIDRRTNELAAKRKEMVEFLREHGQITITTNDRGNIVFQRLASLSDQVTVAHRELIDAQVANRLSRTPARSEAAVAAAQLKYNELKKEFEKQSKVALDLNADAVKYADMAKEVTRLEGLLGALDARVKDLNFTPEAAGTNVITIEAPFAGRNPTKPEKLKVLALAGMAGLLFGGMLITARQLSDDRLRSTDDIIATLGMPVLGMIPHMPGRQSPAIRGRKVQREFMSDVAEAYRTLRTSIYFGTRNTPTKTLLVTSPGQGDGKSTTASNLAIAVAQAGRRTLIVDTDFRRPQLHKIFEIKDEIGLSSVLAGRETLDKAIHAAGVKGLEILPCGPIPSNPSEILNSDAFAKLLTVLSQRYDVVVLDSPPISPITDARILGAICDATLLVLKCDQTTRKAATHAADALHSVGARVLGIVCNGVLKTKNSADRYYGGGYSYPRPASGPSTADRHLPPVAQMVD
jgi:capsular exopolysaccharide synthesis family protein